MCRPSTDGALDPFSPRHYAFGRSVFPPRFPPLRPSRLLKQASMVSLRAANSSFFFLENFCTDTRPARPPLLSTSYSPVPPPPMAEAPPLPPSPDSAVLLSRTSPPFLLRTAALLSSVPSSFYGARRRLALSHARNRRPPQEPFPRRRNYSTLFSLSINPLSPEVRNCITPPFSGNTRDYL